MATSDGWTNNFSTTSPWHDPIVAQQQQQQGATGTGNLYGQSQQTNASRMLGTTPPANTQGGTLAQTAQPASAGWAATPAVMAAPASSGHWLTYSALAQNPSKLSATTPAVAAATTAAAPTSQAYTMPNASKLTVSQGTPLGQAVTGNGSANVDYSHVGNWTNNYGGASIVSVRTTDGNQAYYQFNPQTGQYQFVNVYRPDGTLAQTSLDQTRQQYGGGAPTGYGSGTLTAAQMAQAEAASLGGGVQFQSSQAGNAGNVSTLNSTYQGAEDNYTKGYTDHQTAQTAAANAAQATSDQDYVLNYMIQHGGALPGSYRPGMSGVPINADAIAAAQQAYKDNNSAQFVNSTQLANPDTSAVDQNGLAAALSLNSQYRTGVGGVDAAARQSQAPMSLMYQSGQNQLARNADYATKFNTNLAAYNQAVTNQYQADTNSTGQKLYNDIQSMSDMLQQLQQSAGQLGTSSQQAVQAQITHLQNQIADYNQAANQQNASLTNLANVAKGILSGGGAVASAIVPHI